MQKIVFLGLAGVAGTLGRYWLSSLIAARYGERFPVGTLVVNTIGCLLAGFLFYLMSERFDAGETARSIAFVGFLGAFTTFSAYELQTFTLLRDGEFPLAVLNVVASNLLGLSMVWGGYALARVVAA
ncbi:MAG TPA: fluoride efflux transporter CrcB [Pyrinomonadaceae bacterium]|jgi:CrcB protein|nr:fluoride efflux transporter CrcB [Pyrinomonadaceae bacterium]